MGTLTSWVTTRDARIALRTSDSTAFGSGVSNALPFGTHGGYRYLSYVTFIGASTAGWTHIVGATLYLRTSNQLHVAFGSNPLGYIERCTEVLTEGTADALSTTNGGGVVYPGLQVTATNRATLNPPLTENTWFGTAVTLMCRDALAAGTLQYGFRLSASDTSASHVGELWAREQGSSYRAYLDIEYEVNRPPNDPTLTAPDVGATVSSDAPTFSFSAADPDPSDPMSKYDLQIGNDASFLSVHYNGLNQTSGMSGASVNRVYDGTAFTPGNTYYWRARAYDQAGLASGWSTIINFERDVLPGVIHDGGLVVGGAGTFAASGQIAVPGAAAFGVSTIYPQTILAAGPRAYWSLDDVSGAPQDVSGNDHHVDSVAGTPTYGTPAPSGDATSSITFDGATEFLEIDHNADLHPGDTFTLEAWFKRSAVGARHQILDNGTGDAELYVGADNKVYFGINGGATLLVSSGTYADTGWHHVAAVKDGATRLLYVDGASVGTGGSAATVVASSSNTRIGAKV